MLPHNNQFTSYMYSQPTMENRKNLSSDRKWSKLKLEFVFISYRWINKYFEWNFLKSNVSTNDTHYQTGLSYTSFTLFTFSYFSLYLFTPFLFRSIFVKKSLELSIVLFYLNLLIRCWLCIQRGTWDYIFVYFILFLIFQFDVAANAAVKRKLVWEELSSWIFHFEIFVFSFMSVHWESEFWMEKTKIFFSRSSVDNFSCWMLNSLIRLHASIFLLLWLFKWLK